MKVFALKENARTILPFAKTTKPKAEFEVSTVTVLDSFRGVQNSKSVTTPTRKLPRLTMHDITRVNHATIREGESHRIWPPFALEKFKAAEVIRQSNSSPYVITNANLKRVK
jgi:hypothetical protein